MNRLLAHFNEAAPKEEKAYGAHISLDKEPKNSLLSLTDPEYFQGDSRKVCHLPVLDDDAGAFRVVPSRTAGHQHVYIEKALTWLQCVRLLEVLAELELVDRGWAELCIKQGVMTVRLPDAP